MTEVRLRNVDPEAIEVIREIARRHSKSMESLIKEQLYELADREKNALLAQLRQSREELFQKYGLLPDSTPGIRDEREERW